MKILLASFLYVVALVLWPTVAQQPPPGSGSRAFEKELNELPTGQHFWRIENFAPWHRALN